MHADVVRPLKTGLRLFVETLIVVLVAFALARVIDLLVPPPKVNEGAWKSRMYIMLQLFIDVFVIFGVLVVMNHYGLLLQSTEIGIVAFVIFINVFFIAQTQLYTRVSRIHKTYSQGFPATRKP